MQGNKKKTESYIADLINVLWARALSENRFHYCRLGSMQSIARFCDSFCNPYSLRHFSPLIYFVNFRISFCVYRLRKTKPEWSVGIDPLEPYLEYNLGTFQLCSQSKDSAISLRDSLPPVNHSKFCSP